MKAEVIKKWRELHAIKVIQSVTHTLNGGTLVVKEQLLSNGKTVYKVIQNN